MISGIQPRFSGVYRIEGCQVMDRHTQLPAYGPLELTLPDGSLLKGTQGRGEMPFTMSDPFIIKLARLLQLDNFFQANLARVSQPEYPYFIAGTDRDQMYLIRNDSCRMDKLIFLEKHPLPTNQFRLGRFQQVVRKYIQNCVERHQPVHLKIYPEHGGLLFRFEVRSQKANSGELEDVFCYFFGAESP